MLQASETTDPAAAFALSPQQVNYFDTFGFLKLPGLFAADMPRIVAGFEEAFAKEPNLETFEELHYSERRLIVLSVIDKSPDLVWLRDDPRVLGIVTSLFRKPFEFSESDGSLFYCESSWHADTYGAPMARHHIKLSFYLDPLTADSGAIRLLPGTNHFRETYAKSLRKRLNKHNRIPELLGIDARDVPAYAVSSEPGDVVVWDYRTMHASFNGGDRRRLLSVSFREQLDDDGGGTSSPQPPA